jgi:hypothetical protein
MLICGMTSSTERKEIIVVEIEQRVPIWLAISEESHCRLFGELRRSVTVHEDAQQGNNVTECCERER